MLLILLALRYEARAAGQLPLLTDEPATPRKGALELDAAYAFDKIHAPHGSIASHRGETRLDMAIPAVQMNYGITDRIQGRLEGSMALTTHSSKGSAAAGFGDVSGGLKYRFVDQAETEEEDSDTLQNHFLHAREAPVAASIFPQLTFPTGSEREGLGDGEYSLYTPLDISREINDLTLLGEGAFLWRYHHRSGPNEFELAAAAYYDLTSRLTLLGEQRVNLPTAGQGRAEWLFNLGLWYQIAPHVAVFGSAGRSFRASTRVEEHDVTMLVGAEIVFGRAR